MNEQLAQWIFALNKQFPSVSILLCMMALDFLMGVTVAFRTRTLSSSASFGGMLKKVGMLLLVMTAGLIDLAAGETSYVTAKMVALAFCGTEAWSILENSGRLGIKIPKGLADALVKLRPSESAQQPNNSTVNVQHADNVNVPVTDPGSGINIHEEKR